MGAKIYFYDFVIFLFRRLFSTRYPAKTTIRFVYVTSVSIPGVFSNADLFTASFFLEYVV